MAAAADARATLRRLLHAIKPLSNCPGFQGSNFATLARSGAWYVRSMDILPPLCAYTPFTGKVHTGGTAHGPHARGKAAGRHIKVGGDQRKTLSPILRPCAAGSTRSVTKN